MKASLFYWRDRGEAEETIMAKKRKAVEEVCDNPIFFENPDWDDAIIGTTMDDRVVYDADLMVELYPHTRG